MFLPRMMSNENILQMDECLVMVMVQRQALGKMVNSTCCGSSTAVSNCPQITRENTGKWDKEN